MRLDDFRDRCSPKIWRYNKIPHVSAYWKDVCEIADAYKFQLKYQDTQQILDGIAEEPNVWTLKYYED